MGHPNQNISSSAHVRWVVTKCGKYYQTFVLPFTHTPWIVSLKCIHRPLNILREFMHELTLQWLDPVNQLTQFQAMNNVYLQQWHQCGITSMYKENQDSKCPFFSQLTRLWHCIYVNEDLSSHVHHMFITCREYVLHRNMLGWCMLVFVLLCSCHARTMEWTPHSQSQPSPGPTFTVSFSLIWPYITSYMKVRHTSYCVWIAFYHDPPL